MQTQVTRYYDSTVEKEWRRLDDHWLEFETTYHHVSRLIPRSASLLDIGGGPGRYAFRLAQDGHGVYLADLSRGNIEFARQHAQASGLQLAGCEQMDASDLSRFQDSTFDAVLCLGPLYHIQEPSLRQRVIAELLRVTRPGGHLFAAFITHYAPLYDFIKRSPGVIGGQRANLKRWYASGDYSPSPDSCGFPRAHFVRPQDIAGMFPGDQLEPLLMFGCEGIFNQSEARLKGLEDAIRDEWLALSIEFSCTAIAVASSEHVVLVGRKTVPAQVVGGAAG